MPCSDVTEIIQITLDGDDRLKDYVYSKRTCGEGVGAGSLLLEQLRGMTADELLAADVAVLSGAFPAENELEEFLAFKHFFAIQSVLEVLTGKEPGGKDAPCAAAEISHEEGDLVVTGRIMVDLITEKIRSCGNCKSCGAVKKRKPVFN